MRVLPDVTVDLAASPRQRWVFAEEHVRAAGELLRLYNEDLGIDAESMEYVASLAGGIIPASLLAEMQAASPNSFAGIRPQTWTTASRT